MKYVLILLLAILSFAGTLIGALAATGNLNAETLARLTGGDPEEGSVGPIVPPSALGPEARQLQAKEEELRQREAALNARETQIVSREQGLENLRSTLESLQTGIQSSIEDQEQQRKVRISTAVNTISQMDATKAAEALAGFQVGEQAEILNQIEKDKDRAAIIEAMTPESATRVLKELAEFSPVGSAL